MSKMFNPPHPGFTLRDDVLPALGLTVTDAASQLDVTRVTLSRVLNGQAAISPEMAIRLEAWLGEENGGAAYLWLGQQAAFDEWQARKALGTKVRRIKRVNVAEHAVATDSK
jgi:addiction module HigA family antidote